LYDAANELLTEESAEHFTTYMYDAAGNRQGKEVDDAITEYAWDATGRLTEVEPPTAGPVTFSYNAAGKRVGKTVSISITKCRKDESTKSTAGWTKRLSHLRLPFRVFVLSRFRDPLPVVSQTARPILAARRVPELRCAGSGLLCGFIGRVTHGETRLSISLTCGARCA